MKKDSFDISVRIVSFLFLLGIILLFLNLKLFFFSFNHIQELIKKIQIVIPLTIVGIPSLSLLIGIMISGSNEADISKVIINSIEFIIGLFSKFIPKLNVVKIIKEETLLKLIKHFIRILRKKNIILIIGLTDILLFSCFIYFQQSETYIALNDKNITLDYNKNDHKKNNFVISGFVIGKFLFPPDSVLIYWNDYFSNCTEYKFLCRTSIDGENSYKNGKFSFKINYNQKEIKYSAIGYFVSIFHKNKLISTSDTAYIKINLPKGPLIIWKIRPDFINISNKICNKFCIEYRIKDKFNSIRFDNCNIIRLQLQPCYYDSSLNWSFRYGDYLFQTKTDFFKTDTILLFVPWETGLLDNLK